ncbi:MAG: hypothetical protein AB7O78_00660 [Thermoleophilia bacterium]
MIDWYRETMLDGNRSGAFWLLLAVLVTFVTCRTITRRIRRDREPGAVLRDVVVGGLHIHHIVYGIALVLFAGYMEFRFQPDTPWLEILAVLFGIGAALMLDEFALSLHMSDVYWSDEGRASVDAVIIALTTGGIFVLGIAPVELDGDGDLSRAWLTVWVTVNCALTIVVILKSKWLTAVVGFVVPFITLIAAVRLAKPRSVWARRFYARNPDKQARADRRGERIETQLNRLRDALAGAPSEPDPDL